MREELHLLIRNACLAHRLTTGGNFPYSSSVDLSGCSDQSGCFSSCVRCVSASRGFVRVFSSFLLFDADFKHLHSLILFLGQGYICVLAYSFIFVVCPQSLQDTVLKHRMDRTL